MGVCACTCDVAVGVGAVVDAAPTLTYVFANELPYESSPAKVAVIVY